MTRGARVASRAIAAIALLALVASFVGVERIAAALRGVDLRWWGAALVMSTTSNLVSALRWTRIARALSLLAPRRTMIATYAQAITINLLIPGATLGGDAFRALRLHRLGNALAPSALSVFIDRFSGLWVLAALSLTIATISVAIGVRVPPSAELRIVVLYGVVLVGVVASPRIVIALPVRAIRRFKLVSNMHALLVERRDALAASAIYSVAVQIGSAAALWTCVQAAGAQPSFIAVLGIAAPVFIAGALPLSFAGFGARELAAVLFFPLIGVTGAEGVSAALLYGTCSVAQGLLAAPLFAWTPLHAKPDVDAPPA